MKFLVLLLALVGVSAQDIPMRFYVLGILEKGPNWTPEVTEETKKIQAGHMANIKRLADEKKLLLAGPLAQEGGDMRGIFVFDTDKLADAQAWCDTDPAVRSGRLKVRLIRWYSAKGVGVHPESPAK